MNREEEIVALLNAVLQLKVGDSRVIREPHLLPCTAHRYRDGWTIFHDGAGDKHVFPRAGLGWHFQHLDDITAWLAGTMHPLAPNFIIEGML